MKVTTNPFGGFSKLTGNPRKNSRDALPFKFEMRGTSVQNNLSPIGKPQQRTDCLLTLIAYTMPVNNSQLQGRLDFLGSVSTLDLDLHGYMKTNVVDGYSVLKSQCQ